MHGSTLSDRYALLCQRKVLFLAGAAVADCLEQTVCVAEAVDYNCVNYKLKLLQRDLSAIPPKTLTMYCVPRPNQLTSQCQFQTQFQYPQQMKQYPMSMRVPMPIIINVPLPAQPLHQYQQCYYQPQIQLQNQPQHPKQPLVLVSSVSAAGQVLSPREEA